MKVEGKSQSFHLLLSHFVLPKNAEGRGAHICAHTAKLGGLRGRLTVDLAAQIERAQALAELAKCRAAAFDYGDFRIGTIGRVIHAVEVEFDFAPVGARSNDRVFC